MINHVRADEIRLELKKLQQEKEDYEDYCKDFKSKITEDGNEANTKVYELGLQHGIFAELKDQDLVHLIQDSEELYNQTGDICDELLIITDKETNKYLCQCVDKENELLRELNRLEVMSHG